MATELGGGRVTCEQCGKEFRQIGTHWSRSKDCSHAPISDEKMKILTGMVMGDGNINREKGKNPRFRAVMITKPFLDWLDKSLGWLSTGVSIKRTASENAEQNKDSGFHVEAREENYSDIYRLSTRRHPQISELGEWYSSGKKVFPNDITLTPTVLKMWYVSDGHFQNSKGQRRITLSMCNERGNKQKIEQYFEDIGIEICRWDERKQSARGWRCNVNFHVEETQQLFDYMGDPPPGFEYKWPDNWE